eukprot:COSAG01_NODE_44035_length_423_cov_0.796296_1_plen_116_part_10
MLCRHEHNEASWESAAALSNVTDDIAAFECRLQLAQERANADTRVSTAPPEEHLTGCGTVKRGNERTGPSITDSDDELPIRRLRQKVQEADLEVDSPDATHDNAVLQSAAGRAAAA